MARLNGVVRDDRGHGLIELALITGLIVLTAIGAIASLGRGVNTVEPSVPSAKVPVSGWRRKK